MEEKVNPWKGNFTNGLILGLIGIIYSLLMYFFDLYFNQIQGIVFIIIQVVILFYMLKSYRENYLHGRITYGQALGAGLIIFLFYSIVGAVFAYILYAFIDTGLLDKQLAFTEESMVERGLPEASIEAGMAIQEKIMKPAIMAPISIFGNMLWGLVVSLIVGIFVRKEGNPLIDIPEEQPE